MIWFILFLSLVALDGILLYILGPSLIEILKKDKEVEVEEENVWPHDFHIVEKRREGGKPYFIILRWRNDRWDGPVGRYVKENDDVAYFNTSAQNNMSKSDYSIDKFEWDTIEEAQKIANAYCEYHTNLEYEEVVGEFRVN